MADPIFDALKELVEAMHDQFPGADNGELPTRLIVATNEADRILPHLRQVPPAADEQQLQQIAHAASDYLLGKRLPAFAEEHGGLDLLEAQLAQLVARFEHGPRPVPGVDVPGPDGDYGSLVDLCAAEGVDPRIGAPLLKRAREAWGKVAQPEPSHDVEGEIEALMLTHSSVEPVMGASRILCETAFGTVARAIAARWNRPASAPAPPALAEAREAARQLAGPAAQVVHQFLDALVR